MGAARPAARADHAVDDPLPGISRRLAVGAPGSHGLASRRVPRSDRSGAGVGCADRTPCQYRRGRSAICPDGGGGPERRASISVRSAGDRRQYRGFRDGCLDTDRLCADRISAGVRISRGIPGGNELAPRGRRS